MTNIVTAVETDLQKAKAAAEQTVTTLHTRVTALEADAKNHIWVTIAIAVAVGAVVGLLLVWKFSH